MGMIIIDELKDFGFSKDRMINNSRNYSLFFRFIETYAPKGYQGINYDDNLIKELEELMKKNDQFFIIGDILKMKILYCSNRSTKMIGVEPESITPYDFRVAIHPTDAMRFGFGNSKMFNMASEIFIAEKGDALLSTNFKLRNPHGEYPQVLFQLYIFYSTIPIKSVYLLQLHTNIDWYKKIQHGYHYYVGSNFSNFRFPDEELLAKGNVFSEREFEIIKLIGKGMSSKEIAGKKFLSIHTVNTHRRNILKKSNKATMSELIYDLMDRGVL